MINQAALRLAVWSTSLGLSMFAQPTSVQRGAIPYTLEFIQIYGDTSPTPAPVNPPPPPQLPPDPAPPPALQPFHSYCVAVDPSGGWYLVGGRWWQGLHQFRSNQGAQNFLPKGTNPYLWYIDPVAKTATQLMDLRTLPASLSAPLMSTNSQCLYDPSSDSWLIAGGYGVDPASSSGNMKVFDILLRLNPRKIATIARNTAVSPSARLQAIQAAVQVVQGAPPGWFDVTGGQLRVLGPIAAPTYVLLFGQKFTGNYNPFNQSPDQDYTEEIRYFRISQNPFRVISSGRLTAPSPTGPNADHPFHRRDLPLVNSVDPATGSFRISALGGVFPPGLIAGYLYPVQVTVRNNQITPVIDRASVKRFSQYQCPTVVIWDAAGRTVYHTSFGGIGHYYYHYDRFQQQVYDSVTRVGRNDGLPFIGDISTFLLRADGSSAEFIAPDPIPQNKLRGTSIEFIPSPSATPFMLANGVLNLQSIQPNARIRVGYIYGGVEAVYPLPVIPSFGTLASNALYEVYLTRKPWDGIPASAAHEARGLFAHAN